MKLVLDVLTLMALLVTIHAVLHSVKICTEMTRAWPKHCLAIWKLFLLSPLKSIQNQHSLIHKNCFVIYVILVTKDLLRYHALVCSSCRYKRADLGDNSWLTKYANGRHQEVIVRRLEAERVYQFAVLPENVLGKGKFSRTVTAKTQGLYQITQGFFCL